ncbi:hypothetical protein C7S18_12775 [Ahniella affigens]|uniref:Blue (type 1) copper domain-containing protein n=1 Tax=Ahniella affigens TaxID=2021234 RepID=A0A2P1PT71_9GAMM|nr:hypothetical protein [Ahniella affigens]AVP98022.1 hypothetical protein C7S18_12775 [Ahniella affigens]
MVHEQQRRNPIQKPVQLVLLAIGMFGALGDAVAGPDPCTLGSSQTQTVVNSGFTAFSLNTMLNPTLTVVRGCSYTFNITASGHPFLIKSVQGTGAGNAYNDGVSGNGTQSGTLTWTVAANAPSTLFYNCQFHSPMTGTIQVIDGGPSDNVFASSFE